MEDDQQMPAFILTGDDPLAPYLVMIWACIKNGDLAGALNELNTAAGDLLPKYEETPASEEAIQDAVSCAEGMEAWVK